MTEVEDDASLNFAFWMKVVGVVVLGGIVAMIVFGLIGWAWYTWGIVGMFLFFILILSAISYIYDRRRQKQLKEDEALLAE